MTTCEDEPGVWKSIAAGAVGGLVASFMMNQFQAAVSAISESATRLETRRQGRPAPEEKQESGEDATVKAAEAISSRVLNHELSYSEKKWAGPAVHYGLGTALGAFYGALMPLGRVDIGAGTAYGAAVWLGADEIAVPALGLSGPPTETPAASHVNAFAAHLVFGLVTHLTRKLVLS